MAIQWSDDLATGVDQIDEQHRQIFALYGAFSSACEEGQQTAELLPLFAALEQYCQAHFTDEEQLMIQREYPGLADQQEQHRHFIAELAALRDTLHDTGPTRMLAATTAGTMTRWLINHIRHLDSQIGLFLKSR